MSEPVLDRVATALGVDSLDDTEIEALLDATRAVAHTTERRFAPLSAFLVGVAVGADGDRPRPDRVETALDRLRAALTA